VISACDHLSDLAARDELTSELMQHTRHNSMQLVANIDVADLDQAIDFYCNALGFTLTRRLFGDTVAELSGASSPVYLLLKSAGGTASSARLLPRDYGRHWTPVHLDFIVDDMELATQRALAAGAQLEGPVQSHRWGRLALLSDPFGHGFCLIQFVGKGYDEVG
jgi:uncharacterized glyoxalase superfamily protein PhnB